MAEDLQRDVYQTFVSDNYMVRERFCPFLFFSYVTGGFKCSPDSPSLCIPVSFLFQAMQVHVEQHAGEKRRRTLTEEPILCCPEHKLENTMWSKQHHKEGQLGFIPPSPYSTGVNKRINCRGGSWPVFLRAWDNLQGLHWLFAVCSLALWQRRGLRDPAPHGGADRSWCIPDIFCLLVFHREGSE